MWTLLYFPGSCNVGVSCSSQFQGEPILQGVLLLILVVHSHSRWNVLFFFHVLCRLFFRELHYWCVLYFPVLGGTYSSGSAIIDSYCSFSF